MHRLIWNFCCSHIWHTQVFKWRGSRFFFFFFFQTTKAKNPVSYPKLLWVLSPEGFVWLHRRRTCEWTSTRSHFSILFHPTVFLFECVRVRLQLVQHHPRPGEEVFWRPFCVSPLKLKNAGINPYLPSGPVHPYRLDESISNFRDVWCTFSFLFYFE